MMRQGIERTADWLLEDHHFVWFCRGARWFCDATAFHYLVFHYPAIWAEVAYSAVCFYGEFRDWSSRKRGYTFYLQRKLVSSIALSMMAAVLVVQSTASKYGGFFGGCPSRIFPYG